MELKRFSLRAITVIMILGLVSCLRVNSIPAQADEPVATLLLYNTVDRLLSGDLVHTATIKEVQADLAAFPADWPVMGTGTTDWVNRSGEIVPDGTAGDLNFWWTDPGYGEPPGRIYDLAEEGAP